MTQKVLCLNMKEDMYQIIRKTAFDKQISKAELIDVILRREFGVKNE